MIIRDAEGQPMGCGSISVKLQTLGHSSSEATVGRILRELDFSGFTQKAGFRGRRLSDLGLNRLAELDGKERRLKCGEELMVAVQGHSKEQLLEVLIARRAIESELTFLAAQNATPDEIRTLKAVLARQISVLQNGDSAATEDVDFHNQIVHMARNRILAAAIAIIRQDTLLSPVLERIKRHVHSLLHVVDHQKIVENIASGNGDLARAAMVDHINSLIGDVEKYWEIIDQQFN
ncbi:MAG TPA: FCD domain-containing protein [Negativicutes bacterium]